MILIVSHHMVFHNAFDFLAQPNSQKKLFFGLFQYLPGKIGIALFFIASAWFLSTGTPTLKKSCRKLWLLERELLFWSLLGLLLQFVLAPDSVHFQQIVTSLFPLTTQLWWYATAYALFLVFLPFLTVGLRSLGQQNHKKLIIAMVAVWGISSLVPYESLDIGLNLIGFVYVYTLITYYRWYMRPASSKTIAIAFVSSVSLLLVWNIGFELLYTNQYAGEYQSALLVMDREWSLPVLACSFSVFLFFSRLQFHSRLINTVASWTLGVYLITDHYYVRYMLWSDFFDFNKYYYTKYPIWAFVAILIVVFFGALFMEALRRLMFSITLDYHKGKCFESVWKLLHGNI